MCGEVVDAGIYERYYTSVSYYEHRKDALDIMGWPAEYGSHRVLSSLGVTHKHVAAHKCLIPAQASHFLNCDSLSRGFIFRNEVMVVIQDRIKSSQ